MRLSSPSRPLLRSLVLLAVAGLALGRLALADNPSPAPAPPAPEANDADETRGYVGYGPGLVQRLDDKEREKLGITRKAGLFVAGVTPNSPADKADLKPGDVILKVKGADVTDAEKVDPKDEDAMKAWFDGAFKKLTATIKPGDEVEIVVERAGKTLTLKPVAITKDEMDKLREAARDDEIAVAVPAPDGQGEARAASYDFEKLPEDAVRPEELLAVSGLWEVGTDESSEKENHSLRQSSDLGEGYAIALATGKGLACVDAAVSVRFQLVSGENSVSAGVVLRARDRKNWYAVVADGVAKKLQVIAMVDLQPKVIASADIGSPKLKSWHTLDVKIVGDSIEGTLDGATKVAAKDASLKKTGWFGLLTRGDAETAFDDWKVTPAGAK